MPDVCSHIVAHAPVASCESLYKHTLPVCEAYGCTVKLQFAAVTEISVQGFGSPVCKLLDLRNVVGVAERKHRVGMGLSFEAAADAALDIGAYSYGRGVRRLKVRILRLQLLKLEHEPVEVVVTDERGVVDIISA